MRGDIVLILIITFHFSLAGSIRKNNNEEVSIPEGLLLGAATSAFQVEGAWNIRGESYWDWITHYLPWTVDDRSNGDVAADSYHKYKEDVTILKDIGFNFYRFSLSWPRILPNGVANNVSQDGIRYYNDLIDELRAKGLEPFVTIYHFDHPQILEKMGGWANELMIDWFVDYARVVFRELGPKIKFFSTINEPVEINTIPMFNRSQYEQYLSVHNILKAHAQVYHIYDKEFRHIQNGKIGMVQHCLYFYGENESDTLTPDIAFQYECGWVAHPIYSRDGDYPKVMRDRIDENSRIQGWPRSKLPKFTKEEIKYIKGSSDYFGLNHYTSRIAVPVGKSEHDGWIEDRGYIMTVDPKWPPSSTYVQLVPEGFSGLLRKIRDEYDNPEVYVLENGLSDHGVLTDYERIHYHYLYLKEMFLAMQDGCNVKAYTVWSLIDCFEWFGGYTVSFGIVSVDYNDPDRKRTFKASAKWFKDVLEYRKLFPVENYLE